MGKNKNNNNNSSNSLVFGQWPQKKLVSLLRVNEWMYIRLDQRTFDPNVVAKWAWVFISQGETRNTKFSMTYFKQTG